MSKGVKIELTEDQIREGALVGVERRLMALRVGRPAFHGYSSGKSDGSLPPFELDIQSSCAEYAVALVLEKPWVNRVVEDLAEVPYDIEPNIQVRWTPRYDGRLIVYKDADPSHVYVLVTGSIPVFRVVGYIPGEEAMRDKFWWDGARSPAYFVPQDNLSDN